MISEQMNGTAYIRCLEIGYGKVSSIFMNMPAQVDAACQAIKNDPILSKQPINIIGIS